MELIIVKNNEFDDKAAQLAVDQIRMKADSSLGFATGNTTNGAFRTLADKILNENMDVSKISVFNLDEAIGLPDDHPSRGIYRLKQMLYDPISLRPDQINYFSGKLGDLQEECRNFEAAIERTGGIDLQYIGVGTNGHIAFCEPGTPFNMDCYVVDLNASQRLTMQRKFSFPTLEDVPTKGLTMGMKTIMHTKKPLLLAKGREKADIIYASLYGPVTTEVPSSILQLHPNLIVLLDEDAAEKINRN